MVFLFVCILVFNIILIIYFSNIQVEINNFKFSSGTKEHVNNDYKVLIKWRVLGRLTIKKILITQKKLRKINIKDKMKNIDLEKFKNANILDKKNIRALKNLNIEIKKLNLYMDIGTENAMLTSIIISTISTLISIIVNKKVNDYSDPKYIVNPIYINKNIINIIFSGIFELKIRNIMYIIYILNKKEGVKSYERASNRRAYGYSYE